MLESEGSKETSYATHWESSVGSTVGELTANPAIEKMLMEKLPQVGPIPMRSAQGEIFRKFAQQYHISSEVIEEIDRKIEEITQ